MKEIKICITIQKDEEGFYKTLKLDANDCNQYDMLFAGYVLFHQLANQDPDVVLISTVCNAATAARNLIKEKQNENKDNHSDSDESK